MYGKLKYKKGSFCIIMLQVNDFVNTALCGDTSDMDIREILSQSIIDSKRYKTVYNYKYSFYVGENVYASVICYT